MNNINNNYKNQHLINIVAEFYKYYYNHTVHGINTVFEIFHPNISCMVEGNYLQGSYNLLIWFANQGIHRFEYNNLSGISQILNNNDILINVNGCIRTISLWNQSTNWLRFNELFILENIGNKYVVKNYIISTFN